MTGRRAFIQKILALGIGATALNSLVACGNAVRPAKHKTGVALDPLFFEHTIPEHPENADRLIAIEKELNRTGIWEQLTPIATRQATLDELLTAHDQGYIDEIASMSEFGGGYYAPYKGDTYINSATFEAAKMAAGSAINMNLAVYDRQIEHGFALLRPPGHHALVNQAMGFCIFNSDVIAARALQKQRGVKRIAIIDFDVHHGNGTQDLTDNDPSIMAISIHQHPFWPMTGGAEFTGKSDAKGTVINLPFGVGAGNQTYLNSYDEIIHPKLEAFQPEHIIVFAGYDAHWEDPLAEHRMSVSGFNQLVEKCVGSARQLCNGRISFSLGGGYNLDPLAKSVAGSFNVLLGNEQPKDEIGESPLPEENYRKQIDQLKKHHLV